MKLWHRELKDCGEGPNMHIWNTGLSGQVGTSRKSENEKYIYLIYWNHKRRSLCIWLCCSLCKHCFCETLAKHLVEHQGLLFLKMENELIQSQEYVFKWSSQCISVTVSPVSNCNHLPSEMLQLSLAFQIFQRSSILATLTWSR